MKQEFPDVDST